MKTEQNNLDHLKRKNPFITPKGYMEGLTVNIMSQLPEKAAEKKVKEISLMDRVRPWLYLAAVFAGLGLFFRMLVGPVQTNEENALLVKTDVTSNVLPVLLPEEEDYLEYLEERYVDCLLEEEISNEE
ncbi:MAG: hypothetical protein IKU29_08845 [Parabacteroides sp.]|nr:hypothetical protein [Parabacteroides sp.]